MPAIAANGIAINYRIDGKEGAPWLTFSNSLMTSLTLWDEQVALLADRFRILRYDQRGHGDTEATPPPYDFDLLVGDVIALWDGLGIQRSHFVGLSLGGATGLGLAIGHRERLGRLVLCDCRCDSPPGFREAWDARIALGEGGGMMALELPTVNRWFNEDFRERRPDAMEFIRAMIRTTSLDGFVGCCRALQEIPYRERLGDIDTPILFISGAQDSAATPEYMKPMQEAVPGSAFQLIDPAGHISNIENPDQFNPALESFLTSGCSAQSTCAESHQPAPPPCHPLG